ncbi:hypothetical protein C0J52_13735 [Blattella germanica]|nr:hypothetical protein C0J52_13735 [Blattella germanica]
MEQCHGSLVPVCSFADTAPSCAIIGNWFRKFQNCRWTLQNEHCAGQLHTKTTPENISVVQKLLENLHTTYVEIEKTLGIGSTAANTIFKDH